MRRAETLESVAAISVARREYVRVAEVEFDCLGQIDDAATPITVGITDPDRSVQASQRHAIGAFKPSARPNLS
jgi:hypothetical protein